MRRICALIPAAGRGSRLGLDRPKLLVEIDGKRTIWNILRDVLMPPAEHIHIVLAPHTRAEFERTVEHDRDRAKITTSVQAEPRGMGDAIFGAEQFWSEYDSILIVWGDQVNISEETIRKAAESSSPERTIVLPLASCSPPYVQYDFEAGSLRRVRQTREGDSMDETGDSDVGVFVLSTAGLPALWREYRSLAAVGEKTGEQNFLPFLPFLAVEHGWQVKKIEVADPIEARGVNTPDDLEFARQRLGGRGEGR